MPTIGDHTLMLVLTLILPLWGLKRLPKFIAAVRRGDPLARTRAYRGIIVWQWTLVIGLLIAWPLAGRAWPALGLALPGGVPTYIGLAATVVMLVLCGLQQKLVAGLTPEEKQEVVDKACNTWLVMPTTEAERKLFMGVAVTAGVCEEVLYRGFMLWYLAHWLAPWPAIGVGSVIFGFAHIYQGTSGILKTAVIGLLMGALYHYTGSLLWPALAHAMIDVSAGFIGRRLSGVTPRSMQPVAGPPSEQAGA